MSLYQVMHVVTVSLYVLTLAILTVYGIHRYTQVFLFYRYLRKRPKAVGKFEQLPAVTVQLPMFNERFVAERVIEAACKLDYPRELLQIQVLDDSTDESAEIARLCCERMKAEGHNVQYVHRTNRQGYKAGALENGLKMATGEFVAIFDADFVPNPDMVIRSIDYFTDPNVGCVQSRWGHLNREQSLLTRLQAVFLDGHFVVEHAARNRSGRFINFNGTAGLWRRKSIEDSGGWQHDTLTEDMDLSYRAQLRGWKFVFLSELVSPAELPPEIAAFKQQQHRWTKGSVQTAVKLLPSVMKSPLPWWVKVEAFFHLSSGVVYLPAVVLSLLLFPTWAMDTTIIESRNVLIGIAVMSFFGLLTCSAGTFYVVSQKQLGRGGLVTFLLIPFLMALGMGISLINGIAVLEGVLGKDSEFVRTPKYGTAGGKGQNREWRKKAGVFKNKNTWLPWVELFCGLYMLGCMAAAIWFWKAPGTIPFLGIFAFGYLYVGLLTMHNRWVSWRATEVTPREVNTSKSLAA